MKNFNNENERVELITQKEILSFNEAVDYLDISASLLYKLTSKRVITFTKPNGGKIYFKKQDLNSWMLRNEIKSSSDREVEVLNYLNNKLS